MHVVFGGKTKTNDFTKFNAETKQQHGHFTVVELFLDLPVYNLQMSYLITPFSSPYQVFWILNYTSFETPCIL